MTQRTSDTHGDSVVLLTACSWCLLNRMLFVKLGLKRISGHCDSLGKVTDFDFALVFVGVSENLLNSTRLFKACENLGYVLPMPLIFVVFDDSALLFWAFAILSNSSPVFRTFAILGDSSLLLVTFAILGNSSLVFRTFANLNSCDLFLLPE